MSAGIGQFPVRATDPVLHRQPACRRQVPKRRRPLWGLRLSDPYCSRNDGNSRRGPWLSPQWRAVAFLLRL